MPPKHLLSRVEDALDETAVPYQRKPCQNVAVYGNSETPMDTTSIQKKQPLSLCFYFFFSGRLNFIPNRHHVVPYFHVSCIFSSHWTAHISNLGIILYYITLDHIKFEKPVYYHFFGIIECWVKYQGNESVVQIPGSKVATLRNCLGKIREAQVLRKVTMTASTRLATTDYSPRPRLIESTSSHWSVSP